MILKRYGTSMHSVEINFDSKALNEIGFRRDREHSIPVEEWESGWERLDEFSFDSRAEGTVQDETEQLMLDEIEGGVRSLMAGLGEGEVLLVESEQGADWPKTRHKSKTVVDNGENRLHFFAWVEPPLRIGKYRKR